VSLIEEALRKQREETEQTQSASQSPSAAQPLPPPLPEETSDSPDPAVQRWTWPLLGGIAAASLILVVGIVWLLVFGMKIWRTGPESKTTPPSAAVRAVPAVPVVTNLERKAIAAQPLTPEVPKESAGIGLQTNTPSVAEAAVAPPPAPPVVSTSLPPAAATPSAPPATPAVGEEHKVVRITNITPAATTPVPAAVVAVLWPRLIVTGIIGTSQGARGAVIINKQMLSIGGVIEGVKVVAIDKQSVTLRLGGETRTLMVGGTTE
jgi:hypothetical protein